MKPKYLGVGLVIIIVLVIALLVKGMMKSSVPVSTQSTPAPASSSTTSAVAPSDNIYLTKTDTAKGPYIADFSGMTLYSYDKDISGVSNCTDKCAQIWKPYTSGATAESTLPTNITVIQRADGSSQFAWKGMPLYYYTSDEQVGDVTGDAVGGVWHLVKP